MSAHSLKPIRPLAYPRFVGFKRSFAAGRFAFTHRTNWTLCSLSGSWAGDALFGLGLLKPRPLLRHWGFRQPRRPSQPRSTRRPRRESLEYPRLTVTSAARLIAFSSMPPAPYGSRLSSRVSLGSDRREIQYWNFSAHMMEVFKEAGGCSDGASVN